MIAHFLGTGAAPSMPIAFCSCEACRLARVDGGKNLRRRSSLLVDQELLIDLGPDITTASFDQSVSLDRVRLCLQTHPHEDHFDPELLISRHPEWGTIAENTLTLVGSEATLRQLDLLSARRSDFGSLYDLDVQELLRIRLLSVTAYESMDFGRYRIRAYPANHAVEFDSLLYSVDDGERALFYGTDTSTISDSVWDDLARGETKFDLMVFDRTYGIGMESGDHLAEGDVIRYVEMVRERGILKDDGSVYVTHISHEGMMEHDELEQHAAEYGFHVAYDGLSLGL